MYHSTNILTHNRIATFAEGYPVSYAVIIVDNSSTIGSYYYISMTFL
jgi:hypothetical protein